LSQKSHKPSEKQRAIAKQLWWPKTSLKTLAWFARSKKMASVWMRCGMMISITVQSSHSPAAEKVILATIWESPRSFISAAKYGYLYQGQYYDWQNSPRGTSSLSIPASAFVTFLENHDQVANFGRAQHLRTISSPARYRAMTGLWLLGPGTPMFFQGQEYGAETPFYYFAGHKGDLAEAVREGRRQFMLQFANQDTAEMRSCLKDPAADETFLASRLNPDEFHRHPEVVKMHADLLRVRREDLSPQTAASCRVDGAVLAENCFVLRYLTASGNDRLLIVNLGAGLDLPHLPEPLTAPPAGKLWKLKWSSESPNYGGSGASEPGRFGAWHVVGESTLFLEPSQGAFHSEEPKNGNLG
jgi:maltooligosyltrehalose trehalohydrolase